MKEAAILVIDQGTSATKGFLFDASLNQVHVGMIRHRVHRPRPHWVESDAKEISFACKSLIISLLKTCRSRDLTPAAMGMAFQRSTFLFWSKDTAEPLTPALSWQDTRASGIMAGLRAGAEAVHQITGVPLSAHFGGPKFAYCIREDPELRTRVRSGDVLFGPLSAYVTHLLTGRAVVDQSIAGRTLLIGLKDRNWNGTLLNLFDVPPHCLPPPVPTCHPFGPVKIDSSTLPLNCVIGDQQASLVGTMGVSEGDMSINLGTSGSVLVNSGEQPRIVPSILTSVLYSFDDYCQYLLEGSINGVGSLFRWLESRLGITRQEMNWERRCGNPTRGVLIPGINGMASPYWTDEFETALFGLSPADDPDGVVRAAMESIGFLVADICEVLEKEGGVSLTEPIASGGFSRPVLLQFIADILGRPVWSATERDMTALGVARLTSRQIWGVPLSEGAGVRNREFTPLISPDLRTEKINRWRGSLSSLGIQRHPT